MDSDYFRQITLPFRCKAELIHALMRFVTAQPGAVPRENAFFERFVVEASNVPSLKKQTVAEPWLTEHVARLFWVCCELGLLKYQYPYPHKGQTYLPTRTGWIMARAPKNLTLVFIATAYIVAIIAAPVQHFKRIRNIVAVLTGALLWWRHNETSPFIIGASIAAGIVGAWIASFFSNSANRD